MPGDHKMAKLKGIILGVKNVLVSESGKNDRLDPIIRLIKFLKVKGVTPIVISNHEWSETSSGKPKTLQEYFERFLGPIHFLVGGVGAVPYKQTSDLVPYILTKNGWAPNEVVFLGNSDSDMQSAVNGKVLFLNACWYGE